jgi:hypothetical protein
MKRAALMLVSTLFLFTPTSAHSERVQRPSHDPHGFTQQTSQQHDRVRSARAARVNVESSVRVRRDRARRAVGPEASQRAQIIGGRPAGCPKAFCGCAASIKLFGKIRADLNLASNWLRKFPRTSPAPMMAAARRGHVMVLLEHVGGDRWLTYDGNSGKGLTRIHVRSIRGFAVVNPHGSFAGL